MAFVVHLLAAAQLMCGDMPIAPFVTSVAVPWDGDAEGACVDLTSEAVLGAQAHAAVLHPVAPHFRMAAIGGGP